MYYEVGEGEAAGPMGIYVAHVDTPRTSQTKISSGHIISLSAFWMRWSTQRNVILSGFVLPVDVAEHNDLSKAMDTSRFQTDADGDSNAI